MTVRTLVLLLVLAAAGAAHAHGPFHERIAAANDRVARQPGNPEALIARGELFRQHGDFDTALADFAEAGRVAPANDFVDLLRGRTLVDAGRSHQAMSYLDRYLARHPDSATAYLERARAHEALVAPQAAADDWQRALDRMPRPTPDDYLRRLRAQLAAGRSEAALGGLDEGITRLGPIASLQLPAIDLELQARRWDQALARLARVAAQAERKETFLERRGKILQKAGRREEARQAFRAALDAIAALPESQRGSTAMTELAARLRRQVGVTRPSPAARPRAGGSSPPGDR
jgi:tetratricopeptide (TPR) repeat protein